MKCTNLATKCTQISDRMHSSTVLMNKSEIKTYKMTKKTAKRHHIHTIPMPNFDISPPADISPYCLKPPSAPKALKDSALTVSACCKMQQAPTPNPLISRELSADGLFLKEADGEAAATGHCH